MPPGTALVTGEAGIYGEVSWVVTLRPTPPGLDRLRGNEIALVDMATARHLDIALPPLVASLAEQGASALVILGCSADELKAHAGKRKLPIMLLPAGSDLVALEDAIAGLIKEERYRLYQSEQQLTQALMELALGGRGVEAILHRLREATGRTSLLLDPDFQPQPLPGQQAPAKLKENLARLFATPPAGIAGARLGKDLCGFVSPVSGKRGTEAYLLVLAPAGQLEEADRLAAKVGALALAVELSRQHAIEDTAGRFQAEMVESLLTTQLSGQAISERAERLGLLPGQEYVVLSVQAPAPGPECEALARGARRLLANALCHPHGDVLAIVLPVPQGETADGLRRLAREVSSKMSRASPGPVSLGMGRRYAGPEGLRLSFQESKQALAMGRRLFGEGCVSLFSDLGVYRLLLSVDTAEVRDFYQESIGPLAEYDLKHRSGQMLATLKAVLRYPTLSDTARALNVHRNTLVYRLQRIQEITGLELEDGETRLMLYLALKAGDILRAG